MRETQHAFFHLDQPANNSACPAGPVRVSGWAAGRQGIALVDLRVRLGNLLFPCVHGFPREDLARHFGLRDKYLRGGFEGTIVVPSGSSSLEFEGCTIDGEWHYLESIVLVGEPCSIVVPHEKVEVAAHEFGRALQFALRQSASKSLAVARWLPNPRVTRYPHLPFHGHVDQPALLERALFGRLCVEGWLFHETAEIRSVKATIDLQASQPLAYGGASPYVASLFPQINRAAHCGYYGWMMCRHNFPVR